MASGSAASWRLAVEVRIRVFGPYALSATHIGRDAYDVRLAHSVVSQSVQRR
jgi:hypothetical protein